MVASTWLIYGLVGVRFHGVTIDEPALFYAGDRTLFWVTHAHMPGVLNLMGPDPAGFHSRYRRWPVDADTIHYPVLPGLAAALSARVLSQGLGIVNDVNGHHLGLIGLHALGLFLLIFYLAQLLEPGAALLAGLALVFFPCIAGSAFNNAKDLACADFYGCALVAAAVGYLHRRPRDLLAAGVLLGVSFACKFNAIFALISLVLWWPLAYWLFDRRRGAPSTGVVAALLMIPYLAGAIFFLSWPYLYSGGPVDWLDHLNEYVRYMVSYGIGPRASWTIYPLKALVIQTPTLLLLGAAAGVALAFRRGQMPERQATSALLLIWTGLPVLREVVPHSNFFDANRHFFEYVAGLCALAGIGLWEGGARILSSLPAGKWRVVARGSLLVVLATALLWPIASYAPYEIAYFNWLTRGLGGAQRRALFRMPPEHNSWVSGGESDYWYSSVAQVVADLRSSTPVPPLVGLCGPWPLQLDPQWSGPNPPTFTHDYKNAPVVVAFARESLCSWRDIRGLEATRPVLKRVKREGGLIYEILGPRDGQAHADLSPLTAYDDQFGSANASR